MKFGPITATLTGAELLDSIQRRGCRELTIRALNTAQVTKVRGQRDSRRITAMDDEAWDRARKAFQKSTAAEEKRREDWDAKQVEAARTGDPWKVYDPHAAVFYGVVAVDGEKVSKDDRQAFADALTDAEARAVGYRVLCVSGLAEAAADRGNVSGGSTPP